MWQGTETGLFAERRAPLVLPSVHLPLRAGSSEEVRSTLCPPSACSELLVLRPAAGSGGL